MKKLLIFLPILALVACDAKTGKIDAFAKYPPDEFAVSTKRPLVIPPEFTLRPPSNEPLPSENQTEVARQTIFGAGANASTDKVKQQLSKQGLSAGDTKFLELTSALNPNMNIKDILVTDNEKLDNTKSLADRIFFWRSESRSEYLDPAAEQKRIERNVTIGDSLKNGKVIKVEDKNRNTLFDQIFF